MSIPGDELITTLNESPTRPIQGRTMSLTALDYKTRQQEQKQSIYS